MSNKKRPILALWVSGIYLVLGLACWVLPLVARAEDNMSAIFLVFIAQPWASLWVWVADKLQLDSFMPGMLFMLIGILANTWMIYRLFAWMSRR